MLPPDEQWKASSAIAERQIHGLTAADALLGRDATLLFLFGFLVFGYSMVSGRPLSLHEARLPEVAREMMQHHDWLIPRSGGRPWLERPPLPHWITIFVSSIFGRHCDEIWVVRLPAALAGAITVVLAAWTGARLCGRWAGIGAGVILTTSYEFWTYASLAEDDIFLAPIVAAGIALFVKLEFPRQPPPNRQPASSGDGPGRLSPSFSCWGSQISSKARWWGRRSPSSRWSGF